MLLRERLEGLLLTLWSIPATSDGVRSLAVAAVVGLRVVSFGQLALALPASVAAAESPSWNLAWAAVYLLQSALVIAVLIRGGTPRRPVLCACDVLFFAILFVGQRTYVSESDYYSTWEAWAFGVSMSTVLFSSTAFERYRHSLAAAVVLSTSYLLAVGPSAYSSGAFSSAATNAAGFVANIAVARFVWLFLERLAAEADRARAAVAEEAKADERRQLQHLLHDHQRLLAAMSDGTMSAKEIEGYRRGARSALARLKAFLSDANEKVENATLAGVLRTTAQEIVEIPVVVSVLLVEDLVLSPRILADVDGCVRTLLINVVNHAKASAVTVHGDHVIAEDRWEVTVQDDGCGFDPRATEMGIGLGSQVPDAVERMEAKLEILSRPGIGTRITITGSATPGGEERWSG